MGQVQFPYLKTVETMALSFVLGIPTPYLGAFAGGVFYSIVFCWASYLPNMASCAAVIGAGFQRGCFILLPFSNIVAPGKA
jgi:membrane associated rhomboid family serine protease